MAFSVDHHQVRIQCTYHLVAVDDTLKRKKMAHEKLFAVRNPSAEVKQSRFTAFKC